MWCVIVFISSADTPDSMGICQETSILVVNICTSVLHFCFAGVLFRQDVPERLPSIFMWLAPWGSCPVTLRKNKQKFISTVSRGESRILQAPDSDVSLFIPPGAPGLYTLEVLTDMATCSHLIPEEECVVAPVIQVHASKLPSPEQEKPTRIYTLNIPHCFKDRKRLPKLKVQHFKSDEQETFIQTKTESRKHGTFEIDNTHVRVHKEDFSIFTCTSCEKTCQSTILAFIFGNLNQLPQENLTEMNLKAYLCSFLYRIKDFKQVRCIAQVKLP